ncbi:hypothetical protein GQ53DRAFT_882826 [Thozetella sp. PMI_491]|nr:hypothetical protein GQ53DRAFT_882826 [Thozetella sp. PMI_491]
MAAVAQPPASTTGVKAISKRTRVVETTLNYYKPNEDGSPPNPTYFDRPETYAQPMESHAVTVTDVTGDELEYTLDSSGFQFHPHSSAEKNFDDDDQIRVSYYAEMEQLLKDVTGASRVFIFDHTVRRQQPNNTTKARNLKGPVTRVHVDQSYSSSLERVTYHLPEEAETLLKGRVQIINVWRPLAPVLRDPLAVVNAKSVPDSDLIPTPFIFPGLNAETFSVLYNPAHRWYFKYGLTPGEVLFIKIFDSKTDGRARRVPHTAFEDPSTSPEAPARESIEVRALVFHPDDSR